MKGVEIQDSFGIFKLNSPKASVQSPKAAPKRQFEKPESVVLLHRQ